MISSDTTMIKYFEIIARTIAAYRFRWSSPRCCCSCWWQVCVLLPLSGNGCSRSLDHKRTAVVIRVNATPAVAATPPTWAPFLLLVLSTSDLTSADPVYDAECSMPDNGAAAEVADDVKSGVAGLERSQGRLWVVWGKRKTQWNLSSSEWRVDLVAH